MRKRLIACLVSLAFTERPPHSYHHIMAEMVDPSDDSKREYLLAQIRQKDAIIESLLKQVRQLVSCFSFYGERECLLISLLLVAA